MRFSAHREFWPLARPFRIANREWRAVESLIVELQQDGRVGRGEAQGVFYLGETAAGIYEQALGVASDIADGMTRDELQDRMPPGGARNAIDCAFWDLECKLSGKSIWQLMGIEPRPVTTVFTIGIESSPKAMAQAAAAAADAPILKIKLDADRPVAKLAAIRGSREDARLVIDANQGWDLALLREVIAACADLGVEVLEQPLKRGGDSGLENLDSPVTLAADESCLHRGDLDDASRRYRMINIKLDKTGGLTEALALAAEARERGCELMVGNMIGTSLSMAPSFVIAQQCKLVDLDGPLLLKHDRPGGLRYTNGVIEPFSLALWGGPGGAA